MFRKNNKLFWFLFIFLILPFKSYSFLKIDVEPRVVELDVRKPITKEITVTNQTNEFVRYKISLEKPKNLDEKYYIGDKMVIYPRVISLKPKGNQVIMMRLKGSIDAEGVDFASKICFDELNSKTVSKKIVEEGKASIETKFNVRLEMYALGTSGGPLPTVSLKEGEKEEVESNGKTFKYLVFNAKNKGKKFFKPRAKIELIDEKKDSHSVGQKNFDMILQGEERDLKIDITRFSVGDKLKVEIYDSREPETILFKNDIKI